MVPYMYWAAIGKWETLVVHIAPILSQSLACHMVEGHPSVHPVHASLGLLFMVVKW